MGGKILIIVLLMFLNYLGAYKMMFSLGTSQTVLLAALVVFSLLAVKRMLNDKGYFLASVIFAVQLLNSLYLFYGKGIVLKLAAIIFVNAIGFAIAISSIKRESEEFEEPPAVQQPEPQPQPEKTFENAVQNPNVETYNVSKDAEKTPEEPEKTPAKPKTAKKKPKKKPAKKKPAKKKNSKKK